MKDFDAFLDGEVVNRRQGQEGKFPPHWSEDDINFYMKMDALNDMKALKTSTERMIYRLWHYYERDHDRYWDMAYDYHEYFVAQHKIKIAERVKEGNRKHAAHVLGAREFTLTYSPKWCTDEEARKLMEQAIERLIKYYSDEIVELRAVGEVGSNGLSHVHCFYKLKGGLKITDKNFTRAYKYWNPKKVTSRTGHEGGHHALVRTETDFRGYIDKDIEDAWYEKVIAPLGDPNNN